MRAIMARGGAQEIVKYFIIPSLENFLIKPNLSEARAMTYQLSPAQIQFNENSKIIIQNMFAEHTNRRYIQGLAQKGRDLLPYSAPLGIQTINKRSIGSIIGCSFWVSIISTITIYIGLCLIRDANRKHYEIIVKDNNQIIDVTVTDID